METKEQLIEKLYVLKSILSVISVKREVITNDTEEIRKYNNAIYDISKKIEIYEKNVRFYLENIKSAQNRLEAEQVKVIELEEKLKKEKGLSGAFKRLMHGQRSDLRHTYTIMVNQQKGFVQSTKEQIERFKEILIKNQESVIELKKNLESYNRSLETVKEQLEDHKKSILPVCYSYYESIIEEFHNKRVIDCRDWAYIDLIIFYLESGRGDTMKEALVYVDEEKRVNRVVGALNIASQAISSTIYYTVERLRRDVNNGFNILNTTINSTASQIVSKIGSLEKSITSNVNNISSQISEMTRQIETGNALKAKANVNTSILVNDLNYMISEYKKYNY